MYKFKENIIVNFGSNDMEFVEPKVELKQVLYDFKRDVTIVYVSLCEIKALHVKDYVFNGIIALDKIEDEVFKQDEFKNKQKEKVK